MTPDNDKLTVQDVFDQAARGPGAALPWCFRASVAAAERRLAAAIRRAGHDPRTMTVRDVARRDGRP